MKNSDMPAMPLTGEAYSDLEAHLTHDISYKPVCLGLTKREHFAAMAMQGLLAGGYCIDDPVNRGHDVPSEALMLADTLLAELEKTS